LASLLFRRLASWPDRRLAAAAKLLPRLMALALVQALLAWGVMALTRETGRVAAAWPGSAVLLVFLLLRPRQEWRALILASAGGVVLGSILAEPSLVRAVALSLFGHGESLLSALWLRRGGARRPDLARPRSLTHFALVLLLAPLVSGMLAALFMAGWYGASPFDVLRTWTLAHALGLALVVPLLLAWLRPGWRARLDRGGVLRALGYAGLLVATCLVAFGGNGRPGLFLVFPPLLLMVWRLGATGAATGVVLVAALALQSALAGHGPLAMLPGLAARVQYLQVFLLVLAATMLPVAALLAAHRRLLATQQHRAREVHRQALLLDSALSAMEQGLAAFDARGRLLAANGRYAELLDLPPDLLVRGRPYLDVARHLASRGEFGPGDPDALARERLASSSAGRHHRLNRVRPNGRGLEITGRPLPGGGWVTTVSDMTEQLQRERRLAESEASFRLLTENSGDVVARMGLDGRFRYVSPAALRVLGWAPDALVYRVMMDFVCAEDRAWVASSLAALSGGEVEEATVTFRFQRSDESEAWLEAHARLGRSPEGAPLELVLALRDATDRKAAEAELLAAFEQMEAMAQTDGLTGLANRRRFDEMLNREFRRAMREGSQLGLVLVDADRFKLFNDRYGHAAGDDCLRQISVAVANAARRPGDLAARYGGEEFVLLLPNTDLDGTTEVAERLRQDVLAAGLVHAGNLPLGLMSISLGVASVAPGPDAPVDTDALLRAADAALYAAKAGGRNRVAAGAMPVAA
jgi:diguanylate cyclase (GGDEF)-like protein/PAS domain S-box-containing protein